MKDSGGQEGRERQGESTLMRSIAVVGRGEEEVEVEHRRDKWEKDWKRKHIKRVEQEGEEGGGGGVTCSSNTQNTHSWLVHTVSIATR